MDPVRGGVNGGSKCEILILGRCFLLYTRKRTRVRHYAMTVSGIRPVRPLAGAGDL
jgi:hypothetical protein